MKNILHLKAPGDWINDPNGFIYYKGQYHLFYQYFPCASEWGIMHWGHAVSKDMIEWKHKGVALYPSKSFDRNGCFSGSAVELEDGRLALYYTGVRYLKDRDDNINHCEEGYARQCQIMLISEDGQTFDNNNCKKEIIPAFSDTKVGDPCDFRDPKVFKEGDKYYMVLASTHERQAGVLLVYESDDALEWVLKSRLEDKRFGSILECPDLFKVDGKWVIMCSPMYIEQGNARPHQSLIGIVDFDSDNGEVKLTDDLRYLDYGMDLYAPQSNVDKDGNRTYIGWMRMPVAKDDKLNLAADERSWNGMMALPRTVEIRNDKIYTPVHPEVRKYFENINKQEVKLEINSGTKSRQEDIKQKAYANAIEQKAVISQMNKCLEVRRLEFSLSEGDEVEIDGVVIGLIDGAVYTDRTKRMEVSTSERINMKSITGKVGNTCSLEVYIEPSLIEVFINDGQYVISNVVY